MASKESVVKQAVGQRREAVNAAIEELLPVEQPERLYEAARYLLDAGGKRLRPAMVLLVAESLANVPPEEIDYRSVPTLDGGSASGGSTDRRSDGEPIDAMAAAVSIEVIQSFTLIHDDIMDDDDLRRGVPAAHHEYDTATAILAGDTLYSKAFEIMLQTGATAERTRRALDVLATTCTKICEGQAMDISFEERTDVSPEEYLKMVELKTAVLFGASATVPAILLGADDETVESLYQFGIDVGSAFQIQDDVLDLTVPSDVLGKQRGSDLVENKQTIITVHAREQGVDVDSLVGDDPDAVTEEKIEAAVEKLDAAGSIDYAREKARKLVARGTGRLAVLPDDDAHDVLVALSEYLIERGY